MKNELKPEESRRNFLMKISLGAGALAAVAVTIPVVGALLAPLLSNTVPEWVNVGDAKDFKPGTVTLVTFQNPDPEAYAARLYSVLHELDREGWPVISVEPLPDRIEWAAVRDRLQRARNQTLS